MYPDPRVAAFVDEHFVPVRVHVRDQSEAFKTLGNRYNAHWTPATLVLDAAGVERFRTEGFLPAEDFLPQLMLGLGHAAFAAGDFTGAERWFQQVVDKHPTSDEAAEGLYWSGVSRYKGRNDPGALADLGVAFTRRYQDTPWAKKASVWRKA